MLLHGEFITYGPFDTEILIPSCTEGILWLDPSEYAPGTPLPPSNACLPITTTTLVRVILTNYRLLLLRLFGSDKGVVFGSVPILSIVEVSCPRNRRTSRGQIYLIIPLELVFSAPVAFWERLSSSRAMRSSLRQNQPPLAFNVVSGPNGWTIFNPITEYKRMGVKIPVITTQDVYRPIPNDTVREYGSSFGLKTKDDEPSYTFAAGMPHLFDCLSNTNVINEDSFWELSLANMSYEICPTYPSMLALPKEYARDDARLFSLSRTRAQGRIPVLSWCNKTGALLRSSQPLQSLRDGSSIDCEYLRYIAKHYSNEENSLIYVIDMRPRSSVQLHQLGGGGTEAYPFARISHFDVPSCQAVASRFLADLRAHDLSQDVFTLRSLAGEGALSPDPFILPSDILPLVDTGDTPIVEKSTIASTTNIKDGLSTSPQWPIRLATRPSRQLPEVYRGILSAVLSACEVVTQGSVVLVHCMDGWDRTTLAVSLAMLLLDPYYRTVRGFCVLIEKEWCSFGHRFAARTGLSIDTLKKGVECPVFLLFLELVGVLRIQNPSEYEFNDDLLRYLAYHVYSARYGTFVTNSELERVIAQLPILTDSVWTEIIDNPRFRNNGFTPGLVLNARGWNFLKFDANIVECPWLGFWGQHYGG
ncbi:Myotubularin-like protein [Giardia muris]|uniref:Myotubularin-like protein n=1 Tax=Giardia muris TaxID=5742 RepID=A0A4Z1SXB0_GIAMU|nr:Myotubularin-like protein [Giardia muris]|eukprot:TNJ30364.1 Myotubularin-like protein [Giardia muris]